MLCNVWHDDWHDDLPCRSSSIDHHLYLDLWPMQLHCLLNCQMCWSYSVTTAHMFISFKLASVNLDLLTILNLNLLISATFLRPLIKLMLYWINSWRCQINYFILFIYWYPKHCHFVLRVPKSPFKVIPLNFSKQADSGALVWSVSSQQWGSVSEPAGTLMCGDRVFLSVLLPQSKNTQTGDSLLDLGVRVMNKPHCNREYDVKKV